MSEEKKQRTDDESVKLGTSTQLAPHGERTREGTVDEPEDGKGFISLDEVYETKGFETFETLAYNCQQLDKNKRLSSSGFTVLKLDGCEGFLPGFDRQNAIMGGESFMEALKNGFVAFIKGLKKIIVAVLDWVVGRIRVLLGFEKTERELELVRKNVDLAQELIFEVVSRISSGSDFKLEAANLYEGLPKNITQGEMFNIVYARNRTAMEQVQKLSESNPILKEAATVLMSAGQVARTARATYRQALDNLRIAADSGRVGEADIAKFNNALEEEIITTLNPTRMNNVVNKLLDEVYNIDIKGLGAGWEISKKVAHFRKEIGQSTPLVLDDTKVKAIMDNKEALVRALRSQSLGNFNPGDIKDLQDLISGKDAEVLDKLNAVSGAPKVLNLKYSTYANQISQFIQHADLLSSIVAQTKKNLASLVKWTNDIDRVMAAYIAGDIKKIISVQAEVMDPKKADELIHDKGKSTESLLTVIDYDKMFMAANPKFAGAVKMWRAEGAGFYKKYGALFAKANKALAAIGVRTI